MRAVLRPRGPIRPGRGPAALLAVAALVLGACGAATTPSPASPSGSAPASSPSSSLLPPTASPRPTTVGSESPKATGPVVFESVVYPYTLTMPAEDLTRQWRPAIRAWDGTAPFSRTSPVVDANGTADGSLLIWGLPWDGDASGFADLIDEVGGRYNGCSQKAEPASFEVNGLAGVSFLHTCAADTYAVAAVLVKDGYGLVFRVVGDARVHDPAVLERLKGWITGATWPTAD